MQEPTEDQQAEEDQRAEEDLEEQVDDVPDGLAHRHELFAEAHASLAVCPGGSSRGSCMRSAGQPGPGKSKTTGSRQDEGLAERA